MTWDACTQDPHKWMRFIECHPGFAGYLQAFGVILTVAGALFGPPTKAIYDRWRLRRARRKAADRIAQAFLEPVEKLIEIIETNLEMIDSVNAQTWSNFTMAAGIEVPMQFAADNLDVEEVDVSRISYIQNLLEAIQEWNREVTAYRFGAKPITIEAGKRNLQPRLMALRNQAKEVRYDIYALGPRSGNPES